MKLTAIKKLSGRIELISGLHIGSGDTEMHIGGTDNPVIKHPKTREPYIPGSSIKGKMRSLLEWKLGVVSKTEGNPLGFGHIAALKGGDQILAKSILKLFGAGPEGTKTDEALINEIGPSRLAFWDCALSREWVKEMNERNLHLTETKMENMIDRIQGVAKHPRSSERVPAGAFFDFALTIRVHDGEDLLGIVYEGLKLLELTGLGGSVSRGYGKIKIQSLTLDGQDVHDQLEKVNFSEAA